MAAEIHCPECGSTNVECVEKPHHDHICHDCGHTVLPKTTVPTSLAERIRSEAEISARPGQYDRLMAIADEVDTLAPDTAVLPTPAMQRMDLRVINLKAEAIKNRERAERAEAERDELRIAVSQALAVEDSIRHDDSRLAAYSQGKVDAYSHILAILNGSLSLDEANRLADTDPGIAPRSGE